MRMCDETAAQGSPPTPEFSSGKRLSGGKMAPLGIAADKKFEGLHRLAGAVLIRAIADLHGGSQIKREDASRWMNDPSEEEFSFAFCCRLLNRDPDRVRRSLEHQRLADLRRLLERQEPVE